GGGALLEEVLQLEHDGGRRLPLRLLRLEGRLVGEAEAGELGVEEEPGGAAPGAVAELDRDVAGGGLGAGRGAGQRDVQAAAHRALARELAEGLEPVARRPHEDGVERARGDVDAEDGPAALGAGPAAPAALRLRRAAAGDGGGGLQGV